MDLSRRGLMKLFSAGAAIVPVVGGLPMPEAQAVLVAEPKIHVPKPDLASGDSMSVLYDAINKHPLEMLVMLRDPARRTVTLRCDSFRLEYINATFTEVTTHDSVWREVRPLLLGNRPILEFRGVVSDGANVSFD